VLLGLGLSRRSRNGGRSRVRSCRAAGACGAPGHRMHTGHHARDAACCGGGASFTSESSISRIKSDLAGIAGWVASARGNLSRAQSQLPGNEDAARATGLHALESHIPAGQRAAHSHHGDGWLGIAILGLPSASRTGFFVLIKHSTRGGRPWSRSCCHWPRTNGEAVLDNLAGLSYGAIADLDVLIA